MNETLKVLKTRRSCKKFADKQITNEELEAILEAGIYAPTGKNLQSPIIVVVQDKPTIVKLSKWNAAVMGATNDTFYGAPTVLIVLADRNNENCVNDGACVLENLMIAAHSMGVASCWINRAREVFDSEEGKAQLKEWGIEGDYQGIGNCVLGYWGMEEPQAKPRKENYIYRV